MRYEPKDTCDIETVEDVETRVYHAFKVTRTLPDPGPRNYISPLGLWAPTEYPSDEVDPVIREPVVNRDYRLAEEVALVWWPKAPIDLDDKLLIAYRCGAPVVIDGKVIHWSGVRRWKDVAYRFHCHRNTAKNRWNECMKAFFSVVVQNCA